MKRIRTVAQAMRHLNAIGYWQRLQKRPIAGAIEAIYRG